MMSKSARRRQRARAQKLAVSAQRGENSQFAEWKQRLQSWLYEIRRRAAVLQSTDANEDAKSGGRIFEVLVYAERYLAKEADPEVAKGVGEEIRQVLRAECAAAAAQVYGSKMHRVVNVAVYGPAVSLARHRRALNARAAEYERAAWSRPAKA